MKMYVFQEKYFEKMENANQKIFVAVAL